MKRPFSFSSRPPPARRCVRSLYERMFPECHDCWQRNAPNINEMAITTIVVVPASGCSWRLWDSQLQLTLAPPPGAFLPWRRP